MYDYVRVKSQFQKLKGNGYAVRSGNSVNIFCLPYGKGATLKGDSALLLVQILTFRINTFSEGARFADSKQEITWFTSLVKIVDNLPVPLI